MATALDNTYTLPRASRYTNYKNGNDLLPLVYGDLTDGTDGVWELPCIDTAAYVYCFAGHETLSVANGNAITVYVDGVATPTGWTFNEAADYESEGVISTITFTSDQANAKVSVRGKGKPTTSGGATLMTNIVDIVYDFLVNEAQAMASADFDATSKALATRRFTDMSYVAAGVLNADAAIWATVQAMMASFRGDAYVNALGYLVLNIDDGTIQTQVPAAAPISEADVRFVKARLRRTSIVNRVPVSYGYNYVDKRYRHHRDPASAADAASIAIYGERTAPTAYGTLWCRDAASVAALQQILVAQHADPAKLWEIEFVDNTPKRAHIEAGDYIVASFDLLYTASGQPLTNEFFRVLEVDTDPNTDTTTFRCLDTGVHLTTAYLADGTYYADGSITAGSERDFTVY